jgi:predicted aspartyl protease
MKGAYKIGITQTKLTVLAVIPTLIFLAFTNRTIATDPGTCYMITSAGTTVELAKLCSSPNNTKTSADSKVFRVPIKRRFGRTPVIEVTFNGKQAFEMILDTGANDTLITQDMANALQIKTTGIMHAQIADGSQVVFLTGEVKSVATGEMAARNLRVAIAPKAGIGLLGHNFFGNYDIKILEKEVEFHSR